MIKWTKPDFQGWITQEHNGYSIRIFPLNNFFEWEVSLQGEIVDSGPGNDIDECKEIVEGVITAVEQGE